MVKLFTENSEDFIDDQLLDREEKIMENWRVALINETRRRQDQIAEADMHRLSLLVPDQPGPLKRAFCCLLTKFAKLMVRQGNRMRDRFEYPGPDTEATYSHRWAD